MMSKNGTVPGEDFDVGKRDPAAEASKGVPKAAREKVMVSVHGPRVTGVQTAILFVACFPEKAKLFVA